MRLLIVGSDKIYAIENFYVKYIQEQGVEVTLFTAQDYFEDYYHKNILNKLLYRAGLSRIIGKVNLLFKRAVSQFKPDIVWIFKGMEIEPSSLLWLRKLGISLVNYNPDNPFIFSGRGSGNKNIRRSLPLYDLFFTYNLQIQSRLEKDYNAKVSFLPFGFDLDNGLYQTLSELPEKIKLCFAGNPDEERAAFISKLAEAGMDIDVYGNDWKRFINHSRVTVFPPVLGDEFWKVLRSYRVQLNLMRPHNEHSHNMRSFEVPGVGGILLAPDTREHRMFFTANEDIFLFGNAEECIEKIRFLLSLNANQADMIRQKARQKSLEAGYQYKGRAQFALKEMKTLSQKSETHLIS